MTTEDAETAITYTDGQIVIVNINLYTMSFKDNSLILTPNFQTVTEAPPSLRGAKVMECQVRDSQGDIIVSQERKHFQSILTDIWKSMPVQKVFQNTTFNMKVGEHKGYTFVEEMNMSFQSRDINRTWKEILNMIHLTKYDFSIRIKLVDGKVFEYAV
jgi:hypothetical protein